MNDLNIVIDKNNTEPAYRQVYLQIRDQIVSGTLHAGTCLPKIRELATCLGIARNTVETAYKQLALEGYAHGTRGVGYLVEELNLDILREAAQVNEPKSQSLPQHATNPLGDNFNCTYDFCYGNRNPRDLPIDTWRACANEVLSSKNIKDAAVYIDPYGLMGLRKQLATHIASTRGVICSPEQIILQPGTQPALGHIALLFEPSERRFAMEDPGYNAASDVLKAYGCAISPIPVHRSPSLMFNMLEASNATCFFCTPSNQFPLGFITPLATRLRIIEWARRNNSFIIEDDYCCEYRYDGSSQIPSMQSLDPNRVIYMGTLSKVLTPSVRLSYLVLPPALLERWNASTTNNFCAIPWLDQRVLELFMERGYWERYARTTVNTYRKRHDQLISAIDKYLGERVKVLGANAGLHILVGDERNRNQKQLIELARNRDVRVYETTPYWAHAGHPMQNFVLVGFSSIEERHIDEGIKRLGQAWYSSAQ